MISFINQIHGVIGISLIVAVAWVMSEDRGRKVNWRWVGGAIALQIALAAVIVRVPLLWDLIGLANTAVAAIERATQVGSSFMFGYLGGGALPFDLKSDAVAPVIVAFQILPLVIVYSALASLLWHWGVLAALVRAVSWVLRKALDVSGVVGLSAGANLFLGVVESPLVVRAYLERVNRAELFAIMVLAMSTISGAILVLYAQTLARAVPDAVGHMITASLISLPAAILIARLMAPGAGETPADAGGSTLRYENSADALVRGTMDGVQLFLAVIGVIIVVFSLVALIDGMLSALPMIGEQPITLRRALGWLLAPFMWTLGIPWAQAGDAGALMGTKAVLNEYVAYIDLAALPGDTFDARSRLIVTYALCGVANLASIGLLVATIGTLAPARRAEVAGLGVRSWIAGNLATAMTGAVIGLVTVV